MKKFLYQKKLAILNISEDQYKNMQEYLKNSNIDLSHVSGRGFRLFKWIKSDPGSAGFGVCWLHDEDMKGLFNNPELFLESLE
jgi:hypothetical protein